MKRLQCRDAEFAAWYYKPYRSIIERNLPLSNTEDADLSFDLQVVVKSDNGTLSNRP